MALDIIGDIFARSRVGTISSELNEPYRNFRYHVSVSGILADAGFTKVSGLGEQCDIITYREGNYKWGITVENYPGLVKYDAVLLEHGFSDNDVLCKWRRQVGAINGGMRVEDGLPKSRQYKRTVTISVLGKGDPSYIGRKVYLYRAFPVSLKLSPLEGRGSDIIIESMTLAHSGLAWGEKAGLWDKLKDRLVSVARQSISDVGDSIDITRPFEME